MYAFSIVCLYLVSCLVSIWLRNFIKFILVVSNCALIGTNYWEAPGEATVADRKHVNSCVSLEHKNQRSWLFATSGENAKSPPVPHISFFPSFTPCSFHSFFFLYALNIPCKRLFSLRSPKFHRLGFSWSQPVRGRGRTAHGQHCGLWRKGGVATGKGRGPGRLAWSWKQGSVSADYKEVL